MNRFQSILYIIFAGSAYSQNPIADNSFLIEEAYNQEDRVVQHISLFDFSTSDEIIYNFTQEWPLFGQKHQLSYTISLNYTGNNLRFEKNNSMLNYRYQLVHSENLAFSPRISLFVPTTTGKKISDWTGGIQGNLPLSISFSGQIVSHINFGLSYGNNQTSSPNPETYSVSSSGFSIIWLVHPNFNLLVETQNNHSFVKGEVNGSHYTNQESEWIINPAFRGAINFENGLQIVPGLSMPVTISDKATVSSILFYVSFEHGY